MDSTNQKKLERISYTMAPGGENHRDNQFIGVEPVLGTGLTAKDVKDIAEYCEGIGFTVEYLDFKEISGIPETLEYTKFTDSGKEVEDAAACVIRNFIDTATSDEIYRESIVDEWDNKYLDPKQYKTLKDDSGKIIRSTHPITGKSQIVKINWKLDSEGNVLRDSKGNPLKNGSVQPGVVKNKHARSNLCLRPGPTALDLRKWCKKKYGRDWRKKDKKKRLEEAKIALDVNQEPNYERGMGRIVDLRKKEALNSVVNDITTKFNEILEASGSESRIVINVVEGNRYFDRKKTGIGFHGDTERVVVICLTIGGGGQYPIVWRWFHKGKIQGEPIEVFLNDGDLYIMSEKAVGTDWMRNKSGYTLRHAAGAKKYLKLKEIWL